VPEVFLNWGCVQVIQMVSVIFRERFGDDVNSLSILFQATVAAGDADKAAELLDHMKERNMQLPRASLTTCSCDIDGVVVRASVQYALSPNSHFFGLAALYARCRSDFVEDICSKRLLRHHGLRVSGFHCCLC
jgi:pentatricopeptide repeat protein